MNNYKVTEFIKDIQDMCEAHAFCVDCPLSTECEVLSSCFDYDFDDYISLTLTTVHNWKQNQKKSFLDDLKERYPSADLQFLFANVCPSHLGYCETENPEECNSKTCEACWNRKE